MWRILLSLVRPLADAARFASQIGSEMVGQKVALKAAEDGTPVVLELGGKVRVSAQIVARRR